MNRTYMQLINKELLLCYISILVTVWSLKLCDVRRGSLRIYWDCLTPDVSLHLSLFLSWWKLDLHRPLLVPCILQGILSELTASPAQYKAVS